MSIDYAAAQALFVRHKSALTRAQKKGPDAVLAAVAKFYADFDAAGFPLPDDWARWERAKDDAELALRRRNGAW